jgi:lysophospholipase L1-like esterase
LEALLNEEAAAGRRYEVINAGVPGWNLANALAYLQAEGVKYEPDVVLLDLTTANDIYGRSALLADNQPPLIKWLRSHTYFWPFLTVQLRWIEARAQGRDRIDVIDPPADPAEYFPLDPNAERWTEIWDSVLAINQLTRERNAQFALVVFPLEFQVLDDSYPTLVQEVLAAKAAEAGIPELDLLPVFQQACWEKPGGACQLEDRYLFADVWMHPSAYGHQLTAAALEAVLADMQ